MEGILTYLFFGAVTVALISLAYAASQRKKYTRRVNSIENRKALLSRASVEDRLVQVREKKAEMNERISSGEKHLSKLKDKVKESNKHLGRINVGLIPPIFRFDDSETLKANIIACREKQFVCIKADKATNAFTNWDWFGSRADGAKMIKDYQALLLGAFNAELEMIRRQMRASTHDIANNKLVKLAEQLGKLGETTGVLISGEYAQLKSEELACWYEELKHREEVKQQRKEQRDLLRAQKGTDDGTEELEEEIATRDTELSKAQRKAEQLAGKERARLELRIEEIKAEKARLEEKYSRTLSQAQITKAGYVYVISNEGSFGQGVVKIGMTRRLDPMDRVNELGDASVPFRFDVHALAFIKDAPRLEKTLHDRFNDLRVNTENLRKEFFRVSPLEVKAVMEDMGVDTDWYLTAEAKEFHESLLMRNALESALKVQEESDLPEAI